MHLDVWVNQQAQYQVWNVDVKADLFVLVDDC